MLTINSLLTTNKQTFFRFFYLWFNLDYLRHTSLVKRPIDYVVKKPIYYLVFFFKLLKKQRPKHLHHLLKIFITFTLLSSYKAPLKFYSLNFGFQNSFVIRILCFILEFCVEFILKIVQDGFVYTYKTLTVFLILGHYTNKLVSRFYKLYNIR